MSNIAVSLQSGIELSVVRFSVQEQLSAAFLIQLDAIGQPDIDPRAIVGHSASFAVQGTGGRRAWSGVCTRIAQTQNNGDTASYSLTLAPALWLLSRRKNYRVFQHASVPEIAQKLLGEWGIKPVLKLDQEYPKLEYRVQYGESDYNFLRRQLAEAGITFYFKQTEAADGKPEETTLVLADAPQRGEPRNPALPFVADTGLADRREHVSNLTVTSEVRPGRVALRDHDFRRPAYALFGQHKGSAEPEAQLEEYLYQPGAAAVAAQADGTTPVADRPAAYRNSDAAATAHARIVGESLRGGGLTINFATPVLDLPPGTLCLITGHSHPAVSSQQGLLVVQQWLTGEEGGDWAVAIVAVPATEPFRPPQPYSGRQADHTEETDIFSSQFVPQKPAVAGLENAIVVGPQGEEIHTDEMGRIRVQFPWDREGQLSETSSCWVRVSQAWAGAGFGATFLPRVGQEVLIAFVGGDPDLPVVVGRVHGPTIPAPFTLPESKTQSGIRTSSTPGGGGWSEIMIDDAKGRELVSMRAERDRSARVGRIDATQAGEKVAFYIADSQTGIEMSKGKIVLTTGEATIVLEGGEVSITAKSAVNVRSGSNAVTPVWKAGAPEKEPVVMKPDVTTPAKQPVKLPVVQPQQPQQQSQQPPQQQSQQPAQKPPQNGAPCVKLGKNQKYKPAILEASKRTGVAPSAIAAMIDAEAAKTSTGEWNPNSKATTSSAQGLTQFLNGTWKEMAMRPDTALHKAALDAGYIRPQGKGFEVVPGKQDELLGMRTNADMSIIAGAEYAKGNLDGLEKAGFITDKTTDDEKARLAYLAHHEGLGGAKDFLRGTIPEARATELLKANVGEKRAAELIARDGSAKAAYTKWLNGYMDKKIVPDRYKCTNEAVDGDQAPQNKAAS